MKQTFWLEKWEKNEIGFHLDAPHPWLVKVTTELNFKAKQTVFVPLCGKTHDIDFLLEQGCNVVANELSELAVQALFERLELTPQVTQWQTASADNTAKQYQAGALTVFVGDYFQLTPSDIRNVYGDDVSWIYDRAALVALPTEMRHQYAQLLTTLCPKASQLLMTLDYPQQQMPGPPFSVTVSEVTDHYASGYQIEQLKQQDILDKEPRFKQRGLTEFNQRMYLLTPNT